MIYKNAEIFNIEEIYENSNGSISWKRVPENVYQELEAPNGKNMACCATGVELRFKMNCDKIILKMAVKEGQGCFHIYRGAIQGGWEDHSVHKTVTTNQEDFIIERSKNPEYLKTMSEHKKTEWNSDVI